VRSAKLLQCEGAVHDMLVKIQQHILSINAFLLPIASEEVVLGDIWLETLDTHLVNYKQKFITFMHRDQLVTLQGEINPTHNRLNYTNLSACEPPKRYCSIHVTNEDTERKLFD